MKLTVQLYDEHSEIKKMLYVIDKICTNLRANQDLNQDHFSRVLEFLTVFVDKYHHGKEEKYLYPAMENAGIQNQGGILENILMKHDLGRRYIRDIRAAYEGISSNNFSATKQILNNGTSYIQHLFNSIDTEDTTLFPLAERILPDESKVILLENFKTIERETLNPCKHEELQKSLQDLIKIYNPE